MGFTEKVNLGLDQVGIFVKDPSDFCFSCRKQQTGACAVWLLITFLRFVVHGLTTGEQYIFRVKAVNAVGTSENSQESEVIKVQAALST